MSRAVQRRWLDRPVDPARDHVLGDRNAEITLVEYGSYACPSCRAASESIAGLRDQLGERVRYVFRNRPLTDNDLARRAAELAEQVEPDCFWPVHVELMTRSESLREEDLAAVAAELGLDQRPSEQAQDDVHRARARVEADEASARASGVAVTPTFFINSRRYDGAWDESALSDAVLGTLGHRVRTAALDFASWGPSAGILLLVATVAAIVLSNSPLGPAFQAVWQLPISFMVGEFGFSMSLLHWINDGLLTIFFLVVGLEIKREFTVGHLATRQSASLPIAAAIGGMVVPALTYLLIVPDGPWLRGWACRWPPTPHLPSR